MVFQKGQTGTVGKARTHRPEDAQPVGFYWAKTDIDHPTTGRMTTTEEIADCRMTHACPRCGRKSATYDESAQSKAHTRLVSGIDFIEEKGVVIGAKCACGWSF